LLGDIRFKVGVGQFISPWMSIAEEARREAAATQAGDSAEHRAAACEKAAVRISVRNLMTFPFVQKAVTAGRLQLHGWYFDLNGGELLGCDPDSGRFQSLSAAATAQAG
jgi:carbonic anhydrase